MFITRMPISANPRSVSIVLTRSSRATGAINTGAGPANSSSVPTGTTFTSATVDALLIASPQRMYWARYKSKYHWVSTFSYEKYIQ
jgi:hypothetical protein